MQQAAAGAPSGSICLAVRQHAGRGRHGRSWISPAGGNLYLSLLWRFAISSAQLGALSLAVGVGIASALTMLGASDLVLKWPNDLHWQRRKLGGILLEVSGDRHASAAVIGIGINRVLDAEHAAMIDQPWVDLATVLAATKQPLIGHDLLAGAIISALLDLLPRYATSGLTAFLSDWAQFDGYRGESVTVNGEISGRYLGINSQGALQLEQQGQVRSIQSGEVQLCRIYTQ